LKALGLISKRHRAKKTLLSQPREIQNIIHQLVLTDDEKLMFVRNFKAGCSTVTHLLYHMSKGARFEGNISDAKDLIRGMPHWPQLEQALGRSDVYRFTMVRDPQARAVSTFRDFVIDQRNRKASVYKDAFRDFGLSEEAPLEQRFDAFLDFVAYCLDQNPEGTDPHFRRQVTNTAFGVMRYNKIGRLENYADDMAQVLSEAGASLPDGVSLAKRVNVSNQKVSFTPSAAQKRKIEHLYAADYEAFGY